MRPNAKKRNCYSPVSSAVLLSLLFCGTAFAQNTNSSNVTTTPKQGNMQGERKESDHAQTPNLRDIKPLPEKEGRREKPLRLVPPKGSAAGTPSAAVQTTASAAPNLSSISSFDGLGIGGGYTPNAAPPDANLAVGDTQIVQWVNESFAVYSKAGLRLYGPAAGNTLFQALGANHPCYVTNDGDPIVQYDKLNNRWVLTQLSINSGQGYYQCVAVSTTSDATGQYNVYAFNYGTSYLNDYPKLAVWSDNYYITFNMFNGGYFFAGSKLCAYDRNAMLAGNPANEVCFQLSSSFGGVLPADLDGTTAPPAGSPEYFVNFDTNSLNIWQMSNINFAAATATLMGPINVPVASFSAACGGGGTCIPQLGSGQQLDSLADRLMYRLTYRNFGDHESLVVNHSVTAGTSVGIRWYEIRTPKNPVLYQQGTFAPDSNYRWMGSAAMDSAGDLAIGYSISSSSMYPGIRFTGRASTDPPGTLGSEVTVMDGTGSQQARLSRWGDYSSLSVDPDDDCTMWYTTEYLKQNGTFNWSTRIANFKFSACGVTTAPAAPTNLTAVAGDTKVALSWNASSGASSYTVYRATTSGGPYMRVISGLAATSYTDTSVTNGTTYYYVVEAVDSVGSSPNSTEASATPQVVVPGAPTNLTANAGNAQVALSWAGSSGATSYNLKSSTTTGGPYNIIAPGLAGTSYTDSGVVNGTTYYYVISALNSAGESGNSNQATATPQAADFSVSASPSSRSVYQGYRTSYTVAVSALSAFAGTVTFNVSGLPAYATASFSPTSLTGSGSSTLSVRAGSATPVGTYTLTIGATSGSLVHSTKVTLVVRHGYGG